LAIVSDHKGRIQTDAVENYVEEFSSTSGSAVFNNLRMAKGTWGKEWSLTFVALLKSSLSANPTVLAISSPCPIVVNTRKNPQIRRPSGSLPSCSPPSPVTFIERTPTQLHPRKRNRVEDLLSSSPEQVDSPSFRDNTPFSVSDSAMSNPVSSTGIVFARQRVPRRSEPRDGDMLSLLCAAELKQQEMVPADISAHIPIPRMPLHTQHIAAEMRTETPLLTSSPTTSFSGLQHIITLLEEVKIKYQPSLTIIEQPQLKHHDSKTLIVKKGKPFRTTLVLRSAALYDSPPFHSADHYSCVALLCNEKGEELTLKNNEVIFDNHGVATFPGLMVMKGTWGKSVRLTFEARWANRHTQDAVRLPPKMLTIAESLPILLMCFTKAPKT